MKVGDVNILITLPMALIPYFSMLLFKLDLTIVNIVPVCIEFNPTQAPIPQRLCLSCFQKDPALIANGFGVKVLNDCSDNIYNAINQRECEPPRNTEKFKKIIYAPLSSLSCE